MPLLTLVAFSSPEAVAAGQIRFAAYGQDPNEVARFLDLGFPLAALLVNCERRWPLRLLAIGFLPSALSPFCSRLRASGFLAALVGSRRLVAYSRAGPRPPRQRPRSFALPPFLAALWFIVPGGTLERLATIPEQSQGAT